MAEAMQKPIAKDLVKKGPKATLKELLEGEAFKSEVRKALSNVKGNPEAFVRAALTAAIRNPTLYKVSPDSLWQCLFDLAALGLYPDGRRAHLVPFWDSQKQETLCQLIIDYKGIAELARKNGDVVYIHCDVVHEGEHYVCQYGTNGRLEHVPDSDCEEEPIRCAYSHVKFLVSGTELLVEEYTQMSLRAIEKVRARSKAKDRGPWVTDFEEMAKKTVFRRHSKTLALSPETRAAVEYGEEAELDSFRGAVPAIIPKRGPALVEVDAELEQVPEKRARSRSGVPAAERSRNEGGRFVAEPEPPKHREEDPGPEARVGQLVFKLAENNLEPADFLAWLKVIGVAPAAAGDLGAVPVHILEDALGNWSDNLWAFKQWKDEGTQQPPA